MDNITQEPSFYGKHKWLKWGLLYFAIAAIAYAGIYYFMLSKQGLNPYSLPPMTTVIFAPCDIDRDKDCDATDFDLITRAIGQCISAEDYNELADADRDGCVTLADQKQLFPTVPSSPKPTLDENASWKSYTSEQLGISFKYPQGWKIDLKLTSLAYGADGALVLTIPRSSGNVAMHLYYYENPKNLSPLEFEAEYIRKKKQEDGYVGIVPEFPNSPEFHDPNDKQITLTNGTIGYYLEKGSCEPTACQKYFFTHNKKLFLFESVPATHLLDNQTDYQTEANRFTKYFHQVLSTFRFLDQTSIPTPTANPNQVLCTQDVKECPDGSYVGRRPPKCGFAPCP